MSEDLVFQFFLFRAVCRVVFAVSLIQLEASRNSVPTRSVSEGDRSEHVTQLGQLRRTSDSDRVGPAKYGRPALALALADAAGW